MLQLLRKKVQQFFQTLTLEFSNKEMEQGYKDLKKRNLIKDFKVCLMFLTIYNLMVIIISSIVNSWTEVYVCSASILILLPLSLFQSYLKKYIQFLSLVIILSFNISRLILAGFHLNSSSRSVLFYMGYALASIEVILCFRLLKVFQKILGIAIALFLRFLIVTLFMEDEGFNVAIFIRNLVIDGFICYTFYDQEVVFRKLYQDYAHTKEELLNLKELLAEPLPQSLVVVNYTSKELLFSNKTFQNAFPMYRSRRLIKSQLSSLLVDPSTIRDTNNNSSNIPLADTKHPLSLAEIFNEITSNDILNNETISFAASINQNYTRRLFEVTLKKVKWDSEDALAVIFNDITYQENLLALKHANIHKDKVLATVSNELRTPLNRILGTLDMTEKQVKDHKIAEKLSLCQEKVYLLLSIVNSIFDLQQISTGKFKLTLSNVDIRKLVSNLAKLFYFQCKEKGLSLEFDIHKSVPASISTDKNMLNQVLIGLVANVLKFTSRGTIKIEVTPSSKNPDCLLLSVSDCCVGIQKEEQKNLFHNHIEGGETLNKNEVDSSLTISKSLAILLNGGQQDNGIEIDSAFGTGSRFYFEIKKNLRENRQAEPIKDVIKQEEKITIINSILEDTNTVHHLQNTIDTHERQTDQDHDYLKDNVEDDYTEFFESPNLKSKLSHYILPSTIRTSFNDGPQSKTIFTESKEKLTTRESPVAVTLHKANHFEDDKIYEVNILFVDDNPFNLLVAKNIMQDFECRIQTASGGQEAIDLVKSNLSEGVVFNVIFMDCQMPVMDGFETTKILNSMIKSGEIPQVAIFGWTANNGEADVKRCYEVGMRGHLPKPTSKSDFLRVLSSL